MLERNSRLEVFDTERTFDQRCFFFCCFFSAYPWHSEEFLITRPERTTVLMNVQQTGRYGGREPSKLVFYHEFDR